MDTSPSTTRTLARLRAGELQGSTHLDLRNCGLAEFPREILSLDETLEVLDLSGNTLSDLPDELASLTRLHTLFASGNRFSALPAVLGRLPELDTLGFKANQIADVPAAALAPTLRWLILTDNRIADLPPSLSECTRLQKLMLAGNRLSRLPARIGGLHRLELLRLSANRFATVEDALPDELLALPRLAWLAHAGNPFGAAREEAAKKAAAAVSVSWEHLSLRSRLGEGASGHIHAARWQPGNAPPKDMALKLFKGSVTSDGLPHCEMAATLAAGSHPRLVGVIGMLDGHPEGTQGLALPLLEPHWAPLAAPPSMQSCSRDVYPDGLRLPAAQAASIARAAAQALDHLHATGLSHGDLYAHNLLVDGTGQALLSDFGAASFLPLEDGARAAALRALDRRALEVLRDELAQRCDSPAEVMAAIG